MSFVEQQVQMLEATGKWPLYPYLQMKRWSDEHNKYEHGLLRAEDGPSSALFAWMPGLSIESKVSELKPQTYLSSDEVRTQLFENGWMIE